jgi:hypothetical protein
LYYILAIIDAVENEDNNTKGIKELEKKSINLKLLKIDNKIDYNYTIKSLKILQTFYKENGMLLSDLKKDKYFLKIASVVNHQFMRLDVIQTINLIKILNLMEVPGSSVVMQSLLQSIRLSINQLNLQEIYFLTLLLKKMEVTHLGQAIKLALVEVFKAQVQLQLDTEKIHDLVSALIYATSYVNDETILEFLIDAIEDNKSPIDLNSAVMILLRLINLKTIPSNFSKIFNKMSNIVIDKTVTLNNYTVMKILDDLCVHLLKGYFLKIFNYLLLTIIFIMNTFFLGIAKLITLY